MNARVTRTQSNAFSTTMTVHPKIAKHVKEMCVDRGYTILEEHANGIITDHGYVIFTGDIKININYIKEITHMMNEEGVKHVILVHNGNVTVNNNNLREIRSVYDIECFPEKSFMINLTHHKLVPRHEKMSPTDEHYLSVARDRPNLPHILDTDPVCRYYNFKAGDILKITRHNGTVAYRIVV